MVYIGAKDVRDFFQTFGVTDTIDLSHETDPGWALREKAHDVRCQLGGCIGDPAVTELSELKDLPIRVNVYQYIASLDGNSSYITDEDVAYALNKAEFFKYPSGHTILSLWQGPGSAKWAFLKNDSEKELVDYLQRHPTDDIRRQTLDVLEDRRDSFHFDSVWTNDILATAMLDTKDLDIRERYLGLLHLGWIFEHSGDSGISDVVRSYDGVYEHLRREDIPMLRRWMSDADAGRAAFGLMLAKHIMEPTEFAVAREFVVNSPVANYIIYRCDRWTTEDERTKDQNITARFDVTLGEFAAQIGRSEQVTASR